MQHNKQTPCEKKGHSWQGTASSVVQHCGRPGCKATIFLYQDQWIEYTPPATKVPPATASVHQPGLWG